MYSIRVVYSLVHLLRLSNELLVEETEEKGPFKILQWNISDPRVLKMGNLQSGVNNSSHKSQ